MCLNFYASLFHKAQNVLTFFKIYSVVNKLFIISTDILTLMLNAVALPSFIQRFPITKNFQLRVYIDIQKQQQFWEMLQNFRTFL